MYLYVLMIEKLVTTGFVFFLFFFIGVAINFQRCSLAEMQHTKTNFQNATVANLFLLKIILKLTV
jgi:hypothetical protein